MKHCRGTALLMCMLMVAIVLLLGVSGARIALQDERAARNDRDRKTAFQAAEAALLDAQLDIGQATDTARGAMFAAGAPAFPAGCGTGALLGLCAGLASGPAWLLVDFTVDDVANSRTVAYGQFTGQIMQVGMGRVLMNSPNLRKSVEARVNDAILRRALESETRKERMNFS